MACRYGRRALENDGFTLHRTHVDMGVAGRLIVPSSEIVASLDVGVGSEGPAVFIIFIVGFIVMAAAGLTEAAFHLHPMVHLAIWIPVIIILSLALLRPFKATMIALSYRNIVREGGTHV